MNKKIIFLVLVAALSAACASGGAKKALSEEVGMEVCPKKYSTPQKKYIYSESLITCYRQADDSVMRFLKGEEVYSAQVYSRGTHKLISTAAYRSDKTIESIKYFDSLGRMDKVIAYNKDAKVESLVIPAKDGRPAARTLYHADGSLMSVQDKAADGAAVIKFFYPGGKIKKCVKGKYTFEYDENGNALNTRYINQNIVIPSAASLGTAAAYPKLCDVLPQTFQCK